MAKQTAFVIGTYGLTHISPNIGSTIMVIEVADLDVDHDRFAVLPVLYRARTRAPQVGDVLAVYLDGSTPYAMAPRRDS